jgi:hypothetical protein
VRFAQATGLAGTGSVIPLCDNQLIYVRMNPRSYTPFGLGPLEVAFDTVNAFLSAHNFAGKLASNAVVQYALWLNETTPVQHERLIRWWQDEIEGTGRVPLLSTEQKPEVLRFAQGTDADLRLNWQEFLIRMIANAFSLPPVLLGLEQDVNRSTAAELLDEAFHSAIVPLARLISEHLTRDLFAKRLGWPEFEFVFNDLDTTDEMEQVQMQTALLAAGVLTVSEVRAMRGLAPLPMRKTKDETGNDKTRLDRRANETGSHGSSPAGRERPPESRAVFRRSDAGGRAEHQASVGSTRASRDTDARGGTRCAALPAGNGGGLRARVGWPRCAVQVRHHHPRRRGGEAPARRRLPVREGFPRGRAPDAPMRTRLDGHVVGIGRRARGRHACGGLDADARHLYRRGDPAARQGGVSRYVVRAGAHALPYLCGQRTQSDPRGPCPAAERSKKGKHMESQTGESMGTLSENFERMAIRMEAAASLFERTVAMLEERESARSGEVQKIVAAVETSRENELLRKLEAAEQQIAELQAQIGTQVGTHGEVPVPSARKTVPAATAQFLAKQGISTLESVEAGALDAALTGLSLEQRIAVKAQLLRAGLAG